MGVCYPTVNIFAPNLFTDSTDNDWACRCFDTVSWVAGSTYSASGHAGCECVVAVEQWAVVTLGTYSESGGHAGCECIVRHGVMRE